MDRPPRSKEAFFRTVRNRTVGLIVEWPAWDLPEARADLDGGAVVEAAASAETLGS